jgi:hypothetical protein
MSDGTSGRGSGSSDLATITPYDVEIQIGPDKSCTLIFLGPERREILRVKLDAEMTNALAAVLEPEARRKLWEEAMGSGSTSAGR